MFRICAAFVLAAAPAFALSVAGSVHVVDGDTLIVGGDHVRLFGIDAPEKAQTCQDAKGRDWPCGRRATQALKDLVATGDLRCSGTQRDRYDRLLARCFAGGRDLGEQMVAQGMAVAYRRYAMDYVKIEERAHQARLGIWSGTMTPPEEERAQARAKTKISQAASAPPRSDCTIKGNISDRGYIYHMPGSKAYAKTVINTAKGERWFCSEAEARAAGWRPAGRR